MRSDRKQDLTILLVDDEFLIRMGTAAMLEDAGYQVLEADCAEQALNTIATNPEIAVVVTDVQMPGKFDGLALVAILAQQFPKIKALVTSGGTSAVEAYKCGAKKFLRKPYTAVAIQSAVEAVLGYCP